MTFGYTFSGSTQTYGPFIRGYKINSTSGDVSAGLKLGVRPASGNPFTAMTIDNAGNVGIGTTSPVAKIDVSDGNGTGIIAYFGASNVSGANGIYLDRTGSISNPVNIQGTQAGIGVANISLQAGGGNVGIGTTAPDAKLNVAGDLMVGATNKIGFNYAPGNTNFYNYISWDTGGTGALTVAGGLWTGTGTQQAINFKTKAVAAAMSILNNGNVGIGTTSPGAQLDVNGNFKLGVGSGSGGTIYSASFTRGAGALSLPSIYGDGTNALVLAGKSDGTGVVAFGGNVGIGTTSPQNTLQTYGTLKVGGAANQDTGTIALGDDLSTAAYVGMFRGSLAGVIGAGNILNLGGYGGVNINAGNAALGSQSTVLTATTAGNVGIGTVSPVNKFVISNAGAAGFEFDPTAGALITYNRATAAYSPLAITASQTSIMGGNVGIGTTSPGAALDVGGVPSAVGSEGNVAIRAGTDMNLVLGGSGTGSTFFIRAVLDNNTNYSSLTIQGNPLILNPYGTGQNVGIGTTGPNNKLQIQTTAAGDGLSIYNASGGANPTLYLSADSSNTNGASIAYVNATGNLNITPRSGYSSIFTAGNVGIGTTSPGQKLTIAGSGPLLRLGIGVGTDAVYSLTDNAAGSAYYGVESSVGGASFTGSTANAAVFMSGSTAPLQFGVSNTVKMTILNSGNVGIGTTSPFSSLQVQGIGTAATNLSVLTLTNNVANTAGNGVSMDFNPTSDAGSVYSRFGSVMESSTSTSLYFSTYNNLSGIAERMRITGTGNVGIGTTSPWQKLTVLMNASENQTGIAVQAVNTAAAGSQPAVAFLDPSGTMRMNSYLDVSGDTYNIGNAAGSQVLTITQNGNVGIGAVPYYYTLQVGSSNIYGVVAEFQNNTGTCDINPTSSSLSCSSDMTLKKNIVNLADNSTWSFNSNISPSSQDVLGRVLALNPVDYNWNSEQDGVAKHDGFIAQEVQQVFPDLVSQDPHSHLLSLNYIGLIPYTIESIKEMNLNITNLDDMTKPNSWRDDIANWLADSANGITSIFSKKITTDQLCVGTVCVTQQQFMQMVQNSGSQPSSSSDTSSTPPPSDTSSTPPADSSSQSPQTSPAVITSPDTSSGSGTGTGSTSGQ